MHFAFDEFGDIREGVRAVCAEFPDEYHRKIDHDRTYPEAFVAALTKAGWMAALIPEEYGGSGLSLTAAGIAFGRLTDLEDLAAHPQNRFITVRSDGGEIDLMAPGFVIRGAELEYGPVPSLGEHDADIRAEFRPDTS